MRSLVRRPFAVALVVPVAAAIAACSGGPAATGTPATGSPATAGPAPTSAPVASSAADATGGAGNTATFCALFTVAEVGSFMGASVGVDSTNTDPDSCVWFTTTGTSILMKKVDAGTCGDDESLVKA